MCGAGEGFGSGTENNDTYLMRQVLKDVVRFSSAVTEVKIVSASALSTRVRDCQESIPFPSSSEADGLCFGAGANLLYAPLVGCI